MFAGHTNMDNKKILLVAASQAKAYEKSKIKGTVPIIPSLGLATVAGSILESNGHSVEILDMIVEQNENAELKKSLSKFQPDIIGVSFTIQNTNRADEIAKIAKEYNKNIVTIAGGPHVSYISNAIKTVEETSFDIAVVGPGDITFKDLLTAKDLTKVNGIVFNRNGRAVITSPREPLKNLDELPMPAWHLFKLDRYKMSKLLARKKRVAPIETSRGCPFRCTYCSRNVFGTTYVYKSPERVAKEFEYYRDYGFEEVQVMDDMFTILRPRVHKICQSLAANKNDILINVMNGIRVNSIDEDLLKTMKAAGVYRASFGAESGNQKVLDDIEKGIKVEDIPKAFKLCRKVGIESLGYFMVGLPADTKETMQDTINIAIESDPDIAKVDISTPIPGTQLFERYQKMGVIKVADWSNFIFHDPREVYDHPTLDWDTIFDYYHQFYKEFYFRPKYIAKRFAHGVKNGTLVADAVTFVKTPW